MRATFFDYVDLGLLHLAKIRRRKLSDGGEADPFYDEFFSENDVLVMESGADRRRCVRGDVLRRALWNNVSIDGQVIDVGCGVGDNLRYVMRQGNQFTGLEYSFRTAAIASRIIGPQASIVVGSGMQMPYASATFDAAMCIEVLEHIPDDERALAEIARILRPRGILILSLPYRHWFPFYLSAMGHYRHYTRGDVTDLLARHGFSVIEYLPNYPTWSRAANYAYITARIYALILRTLGIRVSPLHARLPFSGRPLLDHLSAAIDWMRRRDSLLPYHSLPSSTFVVARLG